MTILGIDTSYNITSVALVRDKKAIACSSKPCDSLGHSPNLVEMIEKVMADANITGNKLDAIAVSKGPGSFTGVRIGMALAKGLSMGWNKPLITIPTLDALALSFLSFSPVFSSLVPRPSSHLFLCPILDARKKEVYTALYKTSTKTPDKSGNYRKISKYMVISPRNLCELINEKFTGRRIHKIILFGTGVNVYKNVFEENIRIDGNKVEYIDNFSGHTAAAAAWLSYKKTSGRGFKAERNLQPLYIRKSEAEMNRKG